MNLQVWKTGPSVRNRSSQKKHHQNFGYRLGYWVLNQYSRPRTEPDPLVPALLANHGKLIQIFFWNFHFRPFWWKTHHFFFEISLLGRHIGRFTGKLVHSTETIYDFFDWNHIWYATFGLDKFSRKTARVTPQNSLIDDWMSFPVKPSEKFPINKPIRINLVFHPCLVISW